MYKDSKDFIFLLIAAFSFSIIVSFVDWVIYYFKLNVLTSLIIGIITVSLITIGVFYFVFRFVGSVNQDQSQFYLQ